MVNEHIQIVPTSTLSPSQKSLNSQAFYRLPLFTMGIQLHLKPLGHDPSPIYLNLLSVFFTQSFVLRPLNFQNTIFFLDFLICYINLLQSSSCCMSHLLDTNSLYQTRSLVRFNDVMPKRTAAVEYSEIFYLLVIHFRKLKNYKANLFTSRT